MSIKRISVSLFFVLCAFLGVPQLAHAAPSVSILSDNLSSYTNSQVPQYEKFEVTFNVTNTVAKNLNFSYAPYTSTNPYPNANNYLNEEQGITVDGQFLPPGETDWNKAYTQPAFYYQDFDSGTHPYGGFTDWYYPNGGFSWKIRFAPTIKGAWKFRIVATDASGSTTSSEQSFTTADANSASSSRHGFVRVSPNDGRYFEFQDGTYFPGLGYNMNYDHIEWVDPVTNNANNFSKMGTNGIQFIRIWLSEWSIFGVGWNPWKDMNEASGNAHDPPWNWIELQSGTSPASEFAVLVGTDNRCMIYGLSTYHPAVKPNTTYRFRLSYAIQSFTGSGNYGLALRLSSDTSNCGNNGNLTSAVNILSSYPHTPTTSWQTIDGTYTTKSGEYFLPFIFVSADNISSGWGSFRSLEVQEVLGNNQFGPNILPKPSIDHHLYFDQRQSLAFDKVVDGAKANGVYLRPVILDHREETLNTIDTVYGNNNYSMSRGRWLETQWYRYLQARWGYSTVIHSWEFVNEGDQGNSHAYGADYLGRYMHGNYSSGTYDATKYFADWHLSSTSVWSGSTADWGLNNYPDIDFADFHQYITETIPDPTDPTKSLPNPEFYDAAAATYNVSMANGALRSGGPGVPVVRGETGFVVKDTSPPSNLILNDTQGAWLHYFIWGGINSGGVLDPGNWYEEQHIYNSSFDRRPIFLTYYNFIKDIPLSNGKYVDAGATAPSGIRAWGQKDVTNARAHLWFSNSAARWNNSTRAVNGTVTIDFGATNANKSLKVQWWDTYTGAATTTQNITTSTTGVLTLTVNNTTDTAVRIGDYTAVPTITPTTAPVCKTGDVNCDSVINITDLLQILNNYGKTGTGDLNGDGKINMMDAAIVIKNWGV